jgi:spore germination protein YaaH
MGKYALGAVAVAAVVSATAWLFWPGGETPREQMMNLGSELPMLASVIEAKREENTGPLVVFGSIPYWDQARASAMFRKHAADFDAVAVYWYRLNEDGTIGKYRSALEDRSLIDFAHQNDVDVYALVANLPESGDWDEDRVNAAIGTPETRAAHVQALVALAKDKGFDGINIDYEFLDDSQTDMFTAFINELGPALDAEGKQLKVAIHAQRRGTETRGQDIPALTGADYLSFMTYDQHYTSSDPGANAELEWTREVLSYARSQGVPMRKILLGIPLDGYNWQGEDGDWDDADGVDYQGALTLAAAEGADIQYDSTAAAPHFSFGNSDGSKNEVWFEDVRSFQAKYDLAKEFKVGGLALWKFGAEDERIYDFLNE